VIRLLQYLFLGHVHTWETLSTNPLQTKERERVVAVGERYIQRCKTCGKVVKRDLI
jgi:hypothetical protein